ncbi:hypothetical protein [Methyloversatilis universalis]|uniref:hypothetical protein n=1 Tax=Methyloversatilis universalis TaxID=378211 RepID=UPI000361FE21|nr:hypothetical protein [Methyloversatilis universalis]
MNRRLPCLFALALMASSPASADAGRYRALIELDAGWPRGCGSAVTVGGWDIRVVRQRDGDEVSARIEVQPPEGNPALPLLARLEVEQFRPAVLLVSRDGLLVLPGFDSDRRVDWATLMRNFMFFGGRLVLGEVGGDVEIAFSGPASRDVTAQYLNCAGDLTAPFRNGS